jgi:hypothetical protein
MDARPLMTILVNAECHFTGHQQRLSGGRDFFESLVQSVSRYAQEFLSQVHHPRLPGDKPQLVQLQKVRDKNLHRLTLLPVAEAVGVGGSGSFQTASHFQPHQETVQMDLTTVQLFDLVDAIDQFLGDRQTGSTRRVRINKFGGCCDRFSLSASATGATTGTLPVTG